MNYIIIYNHQHLIAKPPDLFPAPQMIKRISFVLKLFLISLSGVAIKLLRQGIRSFLQRNPDVSPKF